ncbi:MAG: LysM peptidoglycan-binding domain-containing protein [Anaerolineaceae bacterium]|nr:LysM peptidoglycan-binding domain-containing protein [Anaerolineaceae bacterium]
MPRDIGNEIIVAIAAIGILAFAFVFAIILSLSNTADTSLTATVSNTTQATTGTEVVVLASSTPTEEPPSATPLRIVPRQSDTATPSRVAPSPISTRKPSATPTPTRTPTIAPSSTHTPTATTSPTPILIVTEGLGILPTPTGALSPTTVIATQTQACTVPSGWVVYVVQRGDTLFSIAQGSGSTVSSLQAANCLGNINNIFAGTPIYVPRTPDRATRSQSPYPSGGVQQPRALAVEGCTNQGAQITNLTPGQTVNGVITLRGTANVDQFWYYKIEVRPDFASTYNFYSRSETPVMQGILGLVDTTIFESGAYWIRLTVLANSSGNIAPCTIPVIINNP